MPETKLEKSLFASFSSEKEDSSLLFEAELTPHRSLSPKGLAIILSFLGVVSLSVTTLFWMLGAWPIAGFNGAEMLLAAALLRAHMRGRREREVLLLSPSALRILRFAPSGARSETHLPAAWLTLTLLERPGRVPALYLRTHGRQEEVAHLLGEEAKRSLAEALSEALHRLRHPIFENPQLQHPEHP
jgi:uncharacterized membrane protein